MKKNIYLEKNRVYPFGDHPHPYLEWDLAVLSPNSQAYSAPILVKQFVAKEHTCSI